VAKYTPRRVQAFMILANERRKVEMVQMISTTALGSRADKKELDKQLKELKPL
jgi:hypothetical protein